MDRFDGMVELLLAKSAQMIGCRFTLDRGPHADLEFSPNTAGLSAVDKDNRKPGQFLIQQLGRHHRLFRDLAINPTAVALMRHMIGDDAVRFSSHNSFVKWQDDFATDPHSACTATRHRCPGPRVARR